MTDQLARFTVKYGGCQLPPVEVADPNGLYVRFFEVSALLIAQAAHLKELEQENDDLKLRMGRKTDWSGHWLVARKRDTEPWEVWAFDRYDHAALHFDACQQQWSTVYFARVAHCEGHPLSVTPLIHEMSARLASQAAHLERVHQEHEELKKENEELHARVASLEAGAAPTGSTAADNGV